MDRSGFLYLGGGRRHIGFYGRRRKYCFFIDDQHAVAELTGWLSKR